MKELRQKEPGITNNTGIVPPSYQHTVKLPESPNLQGLRLMMKNRAICIRSWFPMILFKIPFFKIKN